MVKICSKVAASCIPCQRIKQAPRPLPLKPTNKFDMPFRCWAIDLLPNLPITEDGYHHLLLCVDVFSKWVELIPLKTKSSLEVAEALRLNIISRFGVPLELRSDRGLEFAGEVIELCKTLDIRRHVISTMHPQGNG